MPHRFTVIKANKFGVNIMCESMDTILNEYKNADFEKRLSMFMTHTELRNEFVEIDSNDSFEVDKKNCIWEKIFNFVWRFY